MKPFTNLQVAEPVVIIHPSGKRELGYVSAVDYQLNEIHVANQRGVFVLEVSSVRRISRIARWVLSYLS